MPVLLLAGILVAASQSHAQEPIPGTWTFLTRPHADLWYHGLAVTGFRGFAPMPLYSADYVAEVEAAKRAAGVYPTPLDTLAGRFRAGFEQDSTFEILHFVPLYFGLSSLNEMLDAIEDVADGNPPDAFGSNVLAGVLRSRDQRRVLQQFVSALRAEWDLFYRDYRGGRDADVWSMISGAQSAWDRDLAVTLAAFLESRELVGGVVLVSEALGPEGRVFAGNPDDPNDNIVAVSLPDSDAGGVALPLVRELCYPLVSQLVERRGIGAGDRVLAERVSSRAAVRCGAMLLEQHAPQFLNEYRRVFLEQAGETAFDEDSFDRVFSVDDALMQALRVEMGTS